MKDKRSHKTIFWEELEKKFMLILYRNNFFYIKKSLNQNVAPQYLQISRIQQTLLPVFLTVKRLFINYILTFKQNFYVTLVADISYVLFKLNIRKNRIIIEKVKT